MGQLSVFTSNMIQRVQEVQITDRTLMQLNTATFSKNKVINRVARTEVKKVYKHMRIGQSGPYKGQYVCTVQVMVYKPISEAQSKELNNLRAKTAYTVAVVSGVIAGVLTRGVLKRIKLKDPKSITGKRGLSDPAVNYGGHVVGGLAGYRTRQYELETLQSWDAGDILIAMEATVSGGIGQSGHTCSVVVKRSQYDEITLEK